MPIRILTRGSCDKHSPHSNPSLSSPSHLESALCLRAMGKRNRRPAKKDRKKDEERQGRLDAPKKPAEPELSASKGERSLSRSRLGRAGKKGRKNKKEKEKKLPSVGLFVTKELNIAIDTTKATVERIARECRMKNKRFRLVNCTVFRCVQLAHTALNSQGHRF